MDQMRGPAAPLLATASSSISPSPTLSLCDGGVTSGVGLAVATVISGAGFGVATTDGTGEGFGVTILSLSCGGGVNIWPWPPIIANRFWRSEAFAFGATAAAGVGSKPA